MTLRRLAPAEISPGRRDAVDAATLQIAADIIDDVRSRGAVAVRAFAERFGDLQSGDPMILGSDVMQRALESLDPQDRSLLERTAGQIHDFAKAQRAALQPVEVAVPGGRAGHTISPVERAGCYAPGGRYPLPSSVLMTAVTARAAGVAEVWVASPKPTTVTLAAAAIAGAEGVIAVGGAQVIGALAYGADPILPVDVIVGPGNRFVTAAKKLVSGRVGIDMLAGPSELVVLADHQACPDTIAADLLAQAEHDPDARPILVTPSVDLADAVDASLTAQLAVLPTRDVAALAVSEGFCVLTSCLDEAVSVCNQLAPEHLEVLTQDPQATASGLSHYGGLFLGQHSAEVFGDYGVGPNHVLPTGSTARFKGGLSVFDFLRVRTWLQMSDTPEASRVASDAARLARLEGLEGHARSAEARRHGKLTPE